MANGSIEQKVENRLKPIIEDLGYILYDVQYVKEGKIGFFTEEDTTEKTEPITIPVTKIRLKYYIDETADGLVYRPVWSFCCPYQWKDSPEEQELFYIDGETGALIRDAFGW